ncbi:SIR2 family protein, partial [Endozoicomonas sp.]|nr:SIR2 family protein [Endozoicomonas sp.]
MNMSDSADIKNLPDYPTLKKLAKTLWSQDNHFIGAAVMVGAGFSRSSAVSGDPEKKIPLWFDLTSDLNRDLGYTQTNAYSDPLRVAEEYVAQFGRQALSDEINKHINDKAWQPDKNHQSLLSLPWTEILTTNWDTLLERAADDNLQRLYSIIIKQEDLASARPPRIVKLHGTLNTSKELIFTQEDYRQYPVKYAAFVNFARQVFIENELCLIGFSGDDPNFLHWVGWVRDNLADSTRRIYLAGALNLPPSKRKYLESINIAPIDLYERVKKSGNTDDQHREATAIILKELHDLKPEPRGKWQPTQLRTDRKPGQHRKSPDPIAQMKEDRESYPRWLICPSDCRSNLTFQFHDLYQMAGRNELGDEALYEIAWRHHVTFTGMGSELTKQLLPICDPSRPCVLTNQQQMELALWLLKNTRWNPDKAIASKTKCIIEKYKALWSESENELIYHQALIERDLLNYSELECLLEKLDDSQPIWMLRKAMLLSDLSRFDDGNHLIRTAHKQLKKQLRLDPDSIYIRSRLAFADWLVTNAQDPLERRVEKYQPGDYEPYRCDARSYIRELQDEIYDPWKMEQEPETQSSFELGSYKRTWSVQVTKSHSQSVFWDGITSTAGIPIRWGMRNFLIDTAIKVAELPDTNQRRQLALIIRSANYEKEKQIEKHFSRIKIAQLSQ